MGDIRLSICMPTYNFGNFIGEALDSITKQATEEVEIVVVDGASVDHTAEVVRRFKDRFHRLRYHRLPRRGGIDRDMARSVEYATGDYCWLFSADDVMRPGALTKVLDETRWGFDVYLCGLILCTLDMIPIRQHAISNLNSDAEFDLSNPQERITYFRLAQTTTAFFSFMGSLVVKKARWDAIPFNESFDGSLWAHVARILAMLPEGLRLKYLSQPFLDKRGDNDSFMDKGLAHRYRVALDGYERLARTFFPEDSEEAFHIRRTVRSEFPNIGALVNFKMSKQSSEEDVTLMDQMATLVYKDRTVLKRMCFAAYMVVPLPILRVAMVVYRFLKPYVLANKLR
jgi:abequosyltransferase